PAPPCAPCPSHSHVSYPFETVASRDRNLISARRPYCSTTRLSSTTRCPRCRSSRPPVVPALPAVPKRVPSSVSSGCSSTVGSKGGLPDGHERPLHRRSARRFNVLFHLAGSDMPRATSR